jgi:hypothetical protein
MGIMVANVNVKRSDVGLWDIRRIGNDDVNPIPNTL